MWTADWFILKRLNIELAVTDLIFTENWLYVCGDQGLVKCFQNYLKDEQENMMVWTVSSGEMVNCVALWTGAGLVTGSDGGDLIVRNPQSGQLITELTGHQKGCGISGLTLGHLGLWSSSFDCSVRLWSDTNFECVAVLTGHANPVSCLAVDRQAKLQLVLSLIIFQFFRLILT